jgi:ATP phosphoribosyltransferase regulatory subunit
MQMGLECIGDAGNAIAAEVIDLAEQSLALVAEDYDYILKVSDVDILTLLVDGMSDSGSVRSELLKLVSAKNLHGIESLCAENDIPEEKCRTLTELLKVYGTPPEVMPEIEEICRGTEAEEEVSELADVLKGLYPEGGEKDDRKIVLDFSIVGDTNYYNGMAFEGYIEGIPECVLIGGRYDKLMRRMKKKSRAIGFAIYMDTLGMRGK